MRFGRCDDGVDRLGGGWAGAPYVFSNRRKDLSESQRVAWGLQWSVCMNDKRTLLELWETAAVASDSFDPRCVDGLPPAARRYLRRALAPGARLAQVARLGMHGTIRLGDAWHRFEAEQVLRWDRGFVWRASVRKGVTTIVGSDRWLDGEGAMRWKLLGVVPLLKAGGPDITRSAAGRLHIESMWLPAVFLGQGVRWVESDAAHVQADVTAHGEASGLELALDEDGSLLSSKVTRWGNPEGGAFHYADFGAFVDEERTFDGITVPTALRVGWFFGGERFERDGEFIRINVDHAEFR